MERQPSTSLTGITRYRLRLLANQELDDALLRFTEVERRRDLAPYLSFLSLRYLSVDARDTVDGKSVTHDRLAMLTARVNNYRGSGREFGVDEARNGLRRIGRSGVVGAIDINVQFGAQAIGELLDQKLYVRAEAEESVARLAQRPFNRFTVLDEQKQGWDAEAAQAIPQDVVRMRYVIPSPVAQSTDAVHHLHQVMASEVKLRDLSVVAERHPLKPWPSIQQPPVRNPALLGEEQPSLDIAS